MIVRKICFSLLLTIFSFILFLSTHDSFAQELPSDMDKVDIYLMTVGTGDAIYTRFGHTMLRVVDHETGRDFTYNWGIFSFEDPGFAFKFFKGILIYRMDRTSLAATIRHYRDREKRSVWQDKIDLTADQKRRLLSRIAWNMQPENVQYRYQHFYNNCSTKIRDYLDEAVSGKIKEYTNREPVKPVFRDYVRSHLATIPIVVMGLDVFMNSKIDKPITEWDEMFLPSKMREYLMAVPAFNDNGDPKEGSHLLHDSTTILQMPEIPTRNMNEMYYILLAVFGVPSLLICIYRVRSVINREFSEKSKSLIILSLICMGWGLFAGFFGFVMFISWAFSEHLDLHHNANLFIFWPTDWFLVVIGWRLLRKNLKSTSSLFKSLSHYYLLGHIVSGFVLLAVWATQLVDQDVSRVCFFILPLILIMYTLLLYEINGYGRKYVDKNGQ